MANTAGAGSITEAPNTAPLSTPNSVHLSGTDVRLPPIVRTAIISTLAIGSWGILAGLVWVFLSAF